MEELLIIGNGFDLYCGLESSYANFYRYRYQGEILDEVNNIFNAQLNGHFEKVNYWDIILASQHIENVRENNWSDIESILCDYSKILFSNMDSIIEWINHYSKDDFDKGEAPGNPGIYERKLRGAVIALAKLCCTKYTSSQVIQADLNNFSSSLATILLNELNKFEIAFLEFLKEQSGHNRGYIEKSQNLFNELVFFDEERASKFTPDFSINILSFNYTMPLCSDAYIPLNDVRNVHGTLDEENIIFGVDQFDMASDTLIEFTKTYRTMFLTGKITSRLYSKEVDSIKIFGHSLNSADYSYFQAIFDGIDLYNGNTRLSFLYSEYRNNESDNREIREEHYKAVSKLLSKYGNSLDNVSQGRNLLHKLILEGRLSIDKIQ